jgi:hypothetical protein
MACHQFTGEIRAHALGSPVGADAAAHLAICSQCQSALETEERILATINGALSEVMSTAPGPHFIARVRAHVEAMPPRWTPAAWWMRAAAAAVALLIAVVLVSRLPHEGSTTRDTATRPSADVPLATPPERAVDRPLAGATPEPVQQDRIPRRRVLAPERITRTTEVLVPSGEREAVNRLFASLRAGRPEVVSMLMRLDNDEAVIEERGVTIPPLRIEPVVVSAMPSSAFIFEK